MSAQEGREPLQCNEGHWDFSLQEADNQAAVVLGVEVGKFLDTSLIQVDVQPRVVRLLIKARATSHVMQARAQWHLAVQHLTLNISLDPCLSWCACSRVACASGLLCALLSTCQLRKLPAFMLPTITEHRTHPSTEHMHTAAR